MLTIVIASRNRDKVRELRRLLRAPGVRFRSLAEFPSVHAADETGRTFAANAIAKARAVARATGRLAVADDSGLEVEALGWGPGVRSARFAGRHGADGANNAKLLRMLRGLTAGQRAARYRCVLALADPRGLLATAGGTWYGRIAEAPRGRGGFGYDPLFFVPRLGKTVGELPASVKQRLSHRAQAARRLVPILRRLSGQRRTDSGAGPRGRAPAASGLLAS